LPWKRTRPSAGNRGAGIPRIIALRSARKIPAAPGGPSGSGCRSPSPRSRAHGWRRSSASRCSWQEEHGHERDRVADDIDPVDSADREAGDQEAGKAGTGDLAGLEEHLPERVRTDDRLAVDEVDDEGRARRAVHPLEARGEGATDKERPDRGDTGTGVEREADARAPSRTWVAISTRRLSKLSAIVPPNSDPTSSGPSCTRLTRPTSTVEWVSR